MKKNGFTLIELLAVIVILAIIALIATPIILGIINDAREKSNERSVELYASAIKNGIAAYQLREMKEVAPGTYTTSTLPFTVDYDGKVECTSIILSEDSKVSLDGCKVNNGTKEYSYGIEETPSLAGTIGICNPLNIQVEGTYTAGDKYECDVDPNKEGYDYIFYVLNASTTEVNLIMDSNITSTGVAIKDSNPTDKGLVAWVSKTDYTREDIGGTEEEWDDVCLQSNKGPITAIEYLQAATSTWTNTNKQIINTFKTCYYRVCKEMTLAKQYIVKARLPHYDELLNYENEFYSEKIYLINYLDNRNDNSIWGKVVRNGVSGVNGYWTVDSYYDEQNECSPGALVILAEGQILDNTLSTISNGVRPVINLSI